MYYTKSSAQRTHLAFPSVVKESNVSIECNRNERHVGDDGGVTTQQYIIYHALGSMF